MLENAAAYFDFLCPTVYPSHHARGFREPAERPHKVVHPALAAARDRLDALGAAGARRARLRPWLQEFDLGAIDAGGMVGAQIAATREALGEDYAGFQSWNARNEYMSEGCGRVMEDRVTMRSPSRGGIPVLLAGVFEHRYCDCIRQVRVEAGNESIRTCCGPV